MFTNDTFDRILPEKVFGHLAYLLVFFPSIYLGQRFLLSLIIGDNYDTFRQFVTAQVKNERLKEIKGLTKAFAALDDEKVVECIKRCRCCSRPNLNGIYLLHSAE